MAAQGKLTTSLSRWEDVIRTAVGRIEDARGKVGQSMSAQQVTDTQKSLQEAKGELNEIWSQIHTAVGDFAIIKEQTEARKTDAELTKTVIDAWPPSTFLDRMSYLGAGLLAVGSGSFIFAFAAQLASPWNVVPSAILWIAGLVFIVWSLGGLRQFDRARLRVFYERALLVPAPREPPGLLRTIAVAGWRKVREMKERRRTSPKKG